MDSTMNLYPSAATQRFVGAVVGGVSPPRM
jgi:hypothetical protein